MAKRKPSPAVRAARGRRAQNRSNSGARLEWYIENVANVIEMALEQRVRLATHYLKNKIVNNIGTPVSRVGKRVVQRSKPGEFPRADTTQLMRTIFDDVRVIDKKKTVEGYVGTPLDYGAILETSEKLDRSYLVRTLKEERSVVNKILTGPIKT